MRVFLNTIVNVNFSQGFNLYMKTKLKPKHI